VLSRNTAALRSLHGIIRIAEYNVSGERGPAGPRRSRAPEVEGAGVLASDS